jgi:hypothetical protein
MEIEVRNLSGDSWRVTVPGPTFKVEDIRIGLARQHDFYPSTFVFSYQDALLDDDSPITFAPDSERHAFTIVDTRVYPQKAFATVDNAFGFGGTRYSPFYHSAEEKPEGDEGNGRPGDRDGDDDEHEDPFLGVLHGIFGRRRAMEDDPGDDEDAIMRLHRYTHVDIDIVRQAYEDHGRDEMATFHALANLEFSD